MAIDHEKVVYHIRGLLEALGEDPEREGLKETPERVARMYEEVFEGISYSNSEIADMFEKTFTETKAKGRGSAVTVKDICVYSYCEHHMALMYDMHVNVSYLPNGKVIGLSKIARICDMAAKRLQLQERLGQDIAEIMKIVTGSEDVGVVITASHSCMTARGIRNFPARTTTTTFCGEYESDPFLQSLVMDSKGV
ncbi:MAG: GTP cyclohydrolase I [Oscillospiraceae bacterium]|nr:GTP cyclohydrolase I [Oscillospiraceae bacterium]